MQGFSGRRPPRPPAGGEGGFPQAHRIETEKLPEPERGNLPRRLGNESEVRTRSPTPILSRPEGKTPHPTLSPGRGEGFVGKIHLKSPTGRDTPIPPPPPNPPLTTRPVEGIL